MSEKKLKQCSTCGKEMAANAKVCPHCGAKNKKPFYTRPWFIILAVVIIAAIFVPKGNSNENTSSNNSVSNNTEQLQDTVAEIEYVSYSVNDLMTELNENALKANETHKDENVRITGRLGVIDSSGKYISLMSDDQFAIIGVTCYVKNDETKSKIAELAKDSQITLTGKITDVGEVMGYSMNIDAIE